METVTRKSLSVPVHKGSLGLIDFMREWSHLRDNSSPSALAPSKYYECVFKSLTTVTKRIPSTFVCPLRTVIVNC